MVWQPAPPDDTGTSSNLFHPVDSWCIVENVVFSYFEDGSSKIGGSSSARGRAGPTTLCQPGVFGTSSILSITQGLQKGNQGQR